MTDYTALAKIAYEHSENNYATKDARFDVMVECMSINEIADELRDEGAESPVDAVQYADRLAGLQHEVELNQAWDGPESCVGSSKYIPDADDQAVQS